MNCWSDSLASAKGLWLATSNSSLQTVCTLTKCLSVTAANELSMTVQLSRNLTEREAASPLYVYNNVHRDKATSILKHEAGCSQIKCTK